MQAPKHFGRLVNVAAEQISKHLHHHLQMQKLDLTPDQYRILNWLQEDEGCTQQDMAAKARRDRGAICRIVDTLERKGLLERSPDKQDRRINRLYLSNEAKEILPIASRAAQEALGIALKGITAEELTSCSSVLEKIVLTLENERETTKNG